MVDRLAAGRAALPARQAGQAVRAALARPRGAAGPRRIPATVLTPPRQDSIVHDVHVQSSGLPNVSSRQNDQRVCIWPHSASTIQFHGLCQTQERCMVPRHDAIDRRCSARLHWRSKLRLSSKYKAFSEMLYPFVIAKYPRSACFGRIWFPFSSQDVIPAGARPSARLRRPPLCPPMSRGENGCTGWRCGPS